MTMVITMIGEIGQQDDGGDGDDVITTTTTRKDCKIIQIPTGLQVLPWLFEFTNLNY